MRDAGDTFHDSGRGAAAVPSIIAPRLAALAADQVLDEMLARRTAAEAAEVELLALAVHYVHLHPVSDDHPAATPSRGRATAVDPGAIVVDVTTGEVLQAPLAGDGTPAVALFALEQLGAVLEIPYLTAWQLAGDAVELAHRLPTLWRLVGEGTVPRLACPPGRPAHDGPVGRGRGLRGPAGEHPRRQEADAGSRGAARPGPRSGAPPRRPRPRHRPGGGGARRPWRVVPPPRVHRRPRQHRDDRDTRLMGRPRPR